MSNFSYSRRKPLNINFTKCQNIAYDAILDFMDNPFNDKHYIYGLCGAGGVGKTFLIKYLIDNCKYSNSTIKCATPTHTACRLLSISLDGKECNTIQSILGLRLDLNLDDFDPNNPQFNPLGEHKLSNTSILIIDEASMLPSKIVYYLINKCKDYKIKIIFSGDSHQLFPVNERASIAFKLCNKIYYLKEIVRQDIDNPINELLTMLRNDIDNNSFNFLNYIHNNINKEIFNEKNEGFKIIKGKEFTSLIQTMFNDSEYGKNVNKYKLIAYTNPVVTSWNNYIRKEVIKDEDKGIITKNDLLMSYVTLVDEYNSVIIENAGQYIIHSIVEHIDINYQIKGYLVIFKAVFGGYNTPPLFIIDHTDKQSLINYYNSINYLTTKAKQAKGFKKSQYWKDYYTFKKKYLLATNIIDKTGKTLFSRDIDYGFAITAHKSQGSTYENVFIDINDIVYDKNNNPRLDTQDMLRRLYVACSRTKKRLYLRYG